VNSPALAGTQRLAQLRAVALPLLLAALLTRSLFAGGYVLQVDSAFGPRTEPLTWSFGTPVVLLVDAGVHVVGGAATGALCIAASLFLCGFGAMFLLRRTPWWAQCAAGLVAILNPWVFDRTVEGQWGVVAAVGCLFLWLAAFDALQRRPGWKAAALVAIATVALAAFSQNFVGILAVLAAGACLQARPWRDPRRLGWTAGALGLSCALLLYGVLPFFLGSGSGGGTYAAVQQFGAADFAAFRSTPDHRYGLIPALAGLYGEWAERTGRIPVATTGNPWWPVPSAILVALACVGAWRVRSRAWLLIAGLIGLGLSAITATPWGLSAATSLARHVPLVAAYRDAQKWDALWLVALVVLGAAATQAWRARPWLGPAAATLMVMATLLPAGLHELREVPPLTTPVAYPADWYATAAYLESHVPPSAPVAVMPWHLYEPLAFAGRLVANPAGVFFPGTLILPNDPELSGESQRFASPGGIGAEALGPDSQPCALAAALHRAGARWVVLEPTTGSDDVVERLQPCGWEIVQGGAGLTSVLRG